MKIKKTRPPGRPWKLLAIWTLVYLSFGGGCSESPSTGALGDEVPDRPSHPGGPEVVLVSNEDSGDISIVDPVQRRVVATIQVGRRPRGIKASADGLRAYVAVSGSPKCPPWMSDEECDAQVTDKTQDGIAEVDVRAGRLARVLPGGSDPEQFDVTSDGTRIVVSNEDVGQASIVNVESGRIEHAVAVGTEPEGVRISPDDRFAYVTGESDHDVTAVDVRSGSVTGRIEVGLRPRDVVFSADGRRAFVSSEIDGKVSVIDVEAGTVVSQVELPAGSRSMGLALAPDGDTLYVANGRAGTVCEVDTGGGHVGRCVVVGERPWGIALSSDGGRLYSANGPSDDISVVDTATLSVVARIPVGSNPWGVVVSRNPWLTADTQ